MRRHYFDFQGLSIANGVGLGSTRPQENNFLNEDDIVYAVNFSAVRRLRVNGHHEPLFHWIAGYVSI